MNTYNLNCKETLNELPPEEQEEVLDFLNSCDSDDMVTIRLEDDNYEQPRLYGCYVLTDDEYRSYRNSGGIWTNITAREMKEYLQ